MTEKSNKFKINKTSVILMIILVIVSICIYFICAYYLNIENMMLSEAEVLKESDIKQISLIKTIQDILLVVISICGTNLLLTAIVELKSKNSLVEDIILNDVIASPFFYENMEQEKKEKMHRALDKYLYSTNDIIYDMYKNIGQKLNKITEQYYYESCEYIVSCRINNNYIEREITKNFLIKSYSEKCIIEEFNIIKFASKTNDYSKACEISSIKINDKYISVDRDISKTEIEITNLDEQNQYNMSDSYYYNKSLNIDSKLGTNICIKYKTRTTLDDKCSTFRVDHPCKKFSLQYSLVQDDKHRLAVDAFGFLDDAENSINSSLSSNVNITFKDWIFKYDGVVIVIVDK